MRKSLLVSCIVLLASSGALAQCKDTLRAQSPSQIGLSLCPQAGRVMPQAGDTLVITAGAGKISTTVAHSQSALGTQIVDVDITDPAKAQENVMRTTQRPPETPSTTNGLLGRRLRVTMVRVIMVEAPRDLLRMSQPRTAATRAPAHCASAIQESTREEVSSAGWRTS
jgi:hypothetical protein